MVTCYSIIRQLIAMSITTLDSEMPRNLLKIDFWGFTPGHSDAVSVGWHPETKVLIRASG